MNPPPQENVRPGAPAPAPTLAERADEVPAPLSEEEQMERFEAALKESDWGHQPC